MFSLNFHGIVYRMTIENPTVRLCIAFLASAIAIGWLNSTGVRADDPPGRAKASIVSDDESAATEMLGERAIESSHTINATEFGLVAGIDSDQSVSLAKAISHVAESAEFDTVYVPAGVYSFSRSIRLRAGVNLIGDGPGKTVLRGRGLRTYLLQARRTDGEGALVAELSMQNPYRTVMMKEVSNLQFRHVEFEGGIVRFERSSDILLDGNLFRDNRGKSGYASADCERIRIVHNRFESIENGSINLSHHRDCYVAWNEITANELLDSGYAGIRLPNEAMNNVVEHNFIQNHGRGIFVLSSSEGNEIRNNVVRRTNKQGVLIQSSNNRLESNVVIDAGEESIYVIDAVADSSPTPSIADGNHVLANTISDSRRHFGDRFIALKVSSDRNVIADNLVSSQHGREFMLVHAGGNNIDRDNVYGHPVDQARISEMVKSIKELVAAHLSFEEAIGTGRLPSVGGS